jgi:predicted amidohydrolase YtcJ
MNRVISALDRHGFQIMVHAIGDGGIRMTLDALELAAKQNPAPAQGRRNRLEHIESVSREDIPRFGQLGIIASMQPFHANPNSNIFNVWAVNLGPERASRAWSWKSIQDAGGRLAFGTDWPVVGLDPIPGLHTAMTRQTLEGKPPGGFVPEQRLSLSEALRAYTSGAAFAEFAEREKGSLETGMLADVVVWDRDIFSVPVNEVKNAKVVKTIYDGQVVFEHQ